MNKPNRGITVVLLLAVAILNMSLYNAGRKITIHIIPLTNLFRFPVQHSEVKKHSDVKVILKKEYLDEDELDPIIDLIRSYKDSTPVRITNDYRVRFKIHKTIGSEVIYVNQFGDFRYKGKTFKNEKIKKYVFDQLPDYTKGRRKDNQ